MPFETQITIAFGDTDPAGLVYFPNILHYCHLAMERLFAEHCHREYSSLIKDDNLGFPTVRSNAEFLVPIVYGDTILVEIRTLEIGNSSLNFSTRLGELLTAYSVPGWTRFTLQ